MNVLEVRGLGVELPSRGGGASVRAVDGVSFDLRAGEVLGIAGQSGCGKSQLLLSLLGLSPPGARISGSARLAGQELVGLGQRELEQLRGDRISMVFQDPGSALNPYLTIGTQLAEVLQRHRGLGRRAARDAAVDMLGAVHLTKPAERLAQYPHQLSGGMRQRVVIAMALLCQPAVLLADEPTTALDVTVQAQIVALLAEQAARLGTAIVFVTHDLGVLASLADRIAVMEQGRIVEESGAVELFSQPEHEATRRLLAAARELALPDVETLP